MLLTTTSKRNLYSEYFRRFFHDFNYVYEYSFIWNYWHKVLLAEQFHGRETKVQQPKVRHRWRPLLHWHTWGYHVMIRNTPRHSDHKILVVCENKYTICYLMLRSSVLCKPFLKVPTRHLTLTSLLPPSQYRTFATSTSFSMAKLDINVPNLKFSDGNEIPVVSAQHTSPECLLTLTAWVWHRHGLVQVETRRHRPATS